MQYFIGNFKIEKNNSKDYIKKWNKLINANDIVYILGGFIEDKTILSKLNGEKFLIISNQDRKILDNDNLYDSYLDVYKEIVGYKEILINNNLCCLSYAPFLNNCFKYKIYSIYGMNESISIKKMKYFKDKTIDNNINFINISNLNKTIFPISEKEILNNNNNKTNISNEFISNKNDELSIKKRGRPKKEIQIEVSDNQEPKKGRGRPKGSKNKK